MALLRIKIAALLAALLALAAFPLAAQEDEPPPPEPASAPPIALTFTPPDLDGRIVLGIFNPAGKLVRTLKFEPNAPALKVDTNGYLTSWDGRDQAGAACPGGRYSTRGYVVGAAATVEGDAFYFNDWMAEDEIPATGVALREWPDALGVELQTAAGPVRAKIRPDGRLERTTDQPSAPRKAASPASPSPPPVAAVPGRDGSTWMIVDDAGQHAVAQVAADGRAQRGLRVPKGEPQPAEVLASAAEDAILLRETAPGGIERVRLLRRGASVEEKDGRVVADWEVAFERTLQPCARFGVAAGNPIPEATTPMTDTLDVLLRENALEPAKKTTLRLQARATQPGSALVTPDGITLLEISAKGTWRRFAIVSSATPGTGQLFQGDGVVVEGFTLRALNQIAAFDAGSFLLAPPPQ